jgi:hypothetical protein
MAWRCSWSFGGSLLGIWLIFGGRRWLRGFEVTGERVEARLPESPIRFDPVVGAPQGFGAQFDLVIAAALSAANEPRALENAQMPGDGGGRHPKRLGEPSDMDMTAHEPLQDAAPGRIGERGKDRVEGDGTFNHLVNYYRRATPRQAIFGEPADVGRPGGGMLSLELQAMDA